MRKFLAALTLLSLTVDAHAYELKRAVDGRPIHWEEMPVRFAIDGAGSRDVPLAVLERSIRGAFDAWGEIHGSAVSFDYEGVLTGIELGYDRDNPERNHNAIVWSRDSWDFEPDALAVTLTLYRRDSGVLVDADILINERTYVWGEGDEVENDLQNAVTHEIGHFLGFGHSGESEATMFASAATFEIKKRTLHDDDEDAALRVYPLHAGTDFSRATQEGAAFRDDTVPAPDDEVAEPALPPEPRDIGCSAGGAPAPFASFVLLLLAVRRKEST
jgi:hypothetical protein